MRRWYHVPWMHWADNGREGLHGLTPEGPIRPFTLWPSQKDVWQTYAIGFYNARGGYQIGRVWADAHNPDLGALTHGGFAPGTVVAKILFTTTPVAQAPVLSNPIEWTAYIKKTFSFSLTGFPISPRAVTPVRLLQLDMMVRDPRADATGGWVYATWTYNGLQALPHQPGQTYDNRWNNLVPVGLMWGNDPKVVSHAAGNPAPIRTQINPDLKETVINTDANLPPVHLGFGLRLERPGGQLPLVVQVVPCDSGVSRHHAGAALHRPDRNPPDRLRKPRMDAVVSRPASGPPRRRGGALDGQLPFPGAERDELPGRQVDERRRPERGAVLEGKADHRQRQPARRRPARRQSLHGKMSR